MSKLDLKKAKTNVRQYANTIYDTYEVNKQKLQDLILMKNYFNLKETVFSSLLTNGMIRKIDYQAFECEKAKFKMEMMESEVNLEKSEFVLYYRIEQVN